MTLLGNGRNLLIAVILVSLSSVASGQYVLFDDWADTIGVSANTTLNLTSTYEAWIRFTDQHYGTGLIFNEWRDGFEDKLLEIGPAVPYLKGRNFPNPQFSVDLGNSLVDGEWHHIAYVKSALAEHIYLDGGRVGYRQLSPSSIADHGGSSMRIGAIYRDNRLAGSFRGYLDSLRISDNARYTTETYTMPERDMKKDSSAKLLFWFNELPGSSTARDEVTGSSIGVLGEEYPSGAIATSPLFVPEPCSLSILALGGLALVRRGKRVVEYL